MRLLRKSLPLLFLGSVTGLSLSCEKEEDDGHGVVKVQFLRAVSEDTSPFVGTQEVQVTLNYQDCLSNFYEANPNWEQNGVDGGPIFAAYADNDSSKSLCARTDRNDPVADCEVLSIQQDLDNGRMTIRYAINEPDMQNMVLFFGPLPCEELTMCSPIVRAFGNPATGTAGGTTVWNTASFPQPDAACGQNLPIKINASSP